MTEQATGAASKLLMGFESAFNGGSSEGFVLPFNTESLAGKRNKVSPGTIRGNKNPVRPYAGNKSVSGAVVVPVDSIAFWYWLTAALGTATTTGTGPYVHTWKTGASSRGSFCLEVQFLDLDTPLYYLFTGCKVASMSIGFGGDGELLATFNIVGAQATKGTESFDATPTLVDFSRLNNLHASLKEGGSSMSDAKEFNFNLDFAADTSNYVIGGGGVLGSISDGILAATGNVDYLFENAVLLDKAINGTESSLELTLDASSTSELVITLPELEYAEDSPQISGPQGIGVSLEYTGYYEDSAEGAAMQFALLNSEAHS